MFTRIILVVSVIMLAPAASGQKVPIEWSKLLDDAYQYLDQQQNILEADFNLSDYERWDTNQDTGTLTFSNGGVPAVEASVVFVGSFSETSKTWLWGWGNSTIDTKLSEPLLAVKEFGEEHGMEKLVVEKWDAEEVDGWEMAAISNFLLQGKGVYRPPFASGKLFLVIRDIRRLD